MRLRDFQEQKKADRLIYSWPLIIFIGALILAALWGVFKTWRASVAVGRELQETKNKIAESEEARRLLEMRLTEINTPLGIEKEARGRFNLKASGEEMAIFADEKNNTQGGPAGVLGSVWTYIKKFFSGLVPR